MENDEISELENELRHAIKNSDLTEDQAQEIYEREIK